MARKIRGKNEGSLLQRPNGTWREQININGKRVSKGFKQKTDAQKWLRDFQINIDHGLDYQAGKITLVEYLEKWIDNHAPTVRLTTEHQYRQNIRKHIIPNLGNIQLNLRLAQIERFYAELIQSGGGVRTVRITHNILHKSLAKAVRYGIISQNPSYEASLPRYKRGEMQVLDESQISRFLIAAQDSPYLALYYLPITTGMRQGELFGLKWCDLHWDTGKLHIQRQVQSINGKGWKFVEPKTQSGRSTIKLGEGSIRILQHHLEHQKLRKLIVGDRWKEYDLIFPSSVGTPCNPSNLRVDFLKNLEKSGLPKIRFHDLRHTAASLLLNNGIPVIVVSKILGHSKPSVTLDVYGHLYHEMQDEAAATLDKLVTPIQVEFPYAVNKLDNIYNFGEN